ncbi:MAG: IS4 family transposase [Moorea sp. SIO1G6]|nr:IS4 family transposase [Moorena sp. SIO3A2]NET69466.1 IS4 family transposase [Moorena sp. SIO1G6]
MIQELYQKHLKNLLSESQLLFFYLVVIIVQDIKNVKLEKMAESCLGAVAHGGNPQDRAAPLPLPIKCNSRRKKLQRFLSLPIFKVKKLWFPIIREWVYQTFDKQETIYLAIDRTNWNNKNLLMVSLIYKNRALPVYFELLSKFGSSNFSEQKQLFSNIIGLFDDYKVVILGDREFCSVKLAEWLDKQGFNFCLRLKKSEQIELKNQGWISLENSGLKPGISLFFEKVKVTKTQQISGFSVACKWKKSYRKSVTKEGWFILTNMNEASEAISAYKKRFNIEQMFRDYKSGGYNMEGSNVVGKRFISLVIIMSFAYFIATIKGEIINKKGVQNYVTRVKNYGRLTKRHSSFYIGMYAHKWINFMDKCWELVYALMRLSRHKLDNYLRGMRAMKLIQSTF